MKAFETYHPTVLFAYFASVIGLSMFYMHPVYLLITCIGAITLSLLLNKKSFIGGLKFFVPMFFIAAIINPLISHDGEIILFYIDYNAVTLEAIVYGFAMSIMICSVIFWFGCYNVVMTSDKFLYLFGKISPALALVISLTLRLVPRFKHQITVISHAQKTIGMDISAGNPWQRVKSGIRIISILITWALENAIETADSMKARGYGLKNRSTFSLFVFEKRDGFLLGIILTLLFINILGSYFGVTTYYFYPTFTELALTPISIGLYISYASLLVIPIVIEIREAIKWRSLKYNM
ncbi:energy-coupling factor transporter transmembrane component T [Viridibacillus arvi]|uniref:energy-coupling factor transporter transmembrane component T n=1 Tax=Viridibacillus arvi TaxID=263475 RepID=UPI00369D93AE